MLWSSWSTCPIIASNGLRSSSTKPLIASSILETAALTSDIEASSSSNTTCAAINAFSRLFTLSLV